MSFHSCFYLPVALLPCSSLRAALKAAPGVSASLACAGAEPLLREGAWEAVQKQEPGRPVNAFFLFFLSLSVNCGHKS